MKVAKKGFFREKNHQTLAILRLFSNAKKGERDQSNLSVFDNFGIVTPFSANLFWK